MNRRDAARREMTQAAVRYLRSYLGTGLRGALQAGLDRVRSLDVRVTPRAMAGEQAEIAHLAQMLEIGWAY